ncbi:MAG: bacteriocin [Pseudomonadota bacterium]
MKTTFVAIAMIAGLGLAGCNANNSGDRALAGGAIGAATGAVIAGAAGANAGTVLAVGAASGIAGAAVGAATTPRCVDQFGDPIQCP